MERGENEPRKGRVKLTKGNPVHTKTKKIVHWDKKFAHISYELALLGQKDHEIARVLGVNYRIFVGWQERYPELAIALQDGRDIADGKVAQSLYKRALGYSHPDVHISSYQGEVTITPITKHYPPDTAAAVAWLRNRQKEKWGNEVNHLTNLNLHANINLQNISTEDLEKAEQEGMKKLLNKAGDSASLN